MKNLPRRKIAELVRTLSPQRFSNFLTRIFDTSVEDSCTRYTREVAYSLRQPYLIIYRRTHVSPGYTNQDYVLYHVAHHRPSNLEQITSLELCRLDMRGFAGAAIQDAVRAAIPSFQYYNQHYYVTNKSFLHEHERDPEAFETAMRSILDEELGYRMNPIDPLSVAAAAERDEDLFGVVVSALTRKDGIAASVSESGITVLPFLCCDALRARHPGGQGCETFAFNVNSELVAGPELEALYGLQDLIQLPVDEKRIEHFLLDNRDILLGSDYVDLRSQVVIGPNGECPDFFLETSDGLWEVLELKRPVEQRHLYVMKGGEAIVAQYLRDALLQCQKYLHLLDRPKSRKLLRSRLGIEYDEPRITLLIGREQYPREVLSLVEDRFDSRITLRSFRELFQKAVREKTALLRELSTLSDPPL